MDDHGAFASGGLLSDRMYELQDTLGSICCGHTMIRPHGVVEMHHVLRLIGLEEKPEQALTSWPPAG